MKRRKHFVDLRRGESMEIGGALVVLEHKSGGSARLMVLADDSVRVRNPAQIRADRQSGFGTPACQASPPGPITGAQECASTPE